ncbi:hypothetical protein HK102_002734 [Quaeritorhiza haematococci]|nr:hypothetical protein HK102_002734 [Quaeritorhiza haematococci]
MGFFGLNPVPVHALNKATAIPGSPHGPSPASSAMSTVTAASAPAAPATMDSLYKVIALTGEYVLKRVRFFEEQGGLTFSLHSVDSSLFENLGWKVFRVQETATILLGGGVVFAEMTPELAYSFQKDILRVMMTIENTYINLARINASNGVKTVVICDRGAMDPSAYMERSEWLRMLSELELDELEIRDHRYDCVVHLVTAAKGAEAFYTLENNKTRSEGLDLARSLDDKIMNAWNGHAALQVIDNNSVKNFAEKCDRAVQAVLTRLGLVDDTERYGKRVRKHKFLVKNFTLSADFPVPYRDFVVEHIYLANTTNDGKQYRIRLRREQGASTGVHVNMTVRNPEMAGQRVETRRNLSPREYSALRAQADPTRVPINKRRRCFLYKDRYFQIDVFESARPGLVLLEAYLDYETSNNSQNGEGAAGLEFLPDWLDLTEVTDDKAYSMFNLAKKETP